MDLRERSTRALAWSGLDVFSRQGLQFGISIVLARLISPEEFGTIALLYAFIAFGSALIDGGLSFALIQRNTITQADKSTVLWANVLIGTGAASALWASSPAIAAAFNLELLEPLAKALCAMLIFNSLASVHSALLAKQLNYRTPMIIGSISTALSGSAAILLALNGWGVWALAAQAIGASVLTSILLWVFSAWRPSIKFSLRSARSLFGFGSYLMVSALLDILYTRMYVVLIGRFYGMSEIGLYSRADSTKQVPVDILSGTVGRVAFPLFSTVSLENERLKRGAQLSIRGMMFINAPIMLGLSAVSESAIFVLFGEPWLPAAPLLQVLSLAGLLWPLHVINLNLLIAQGYSRNFFWLEVWKKIAGVLLVLTALPFGVLVIAWSQVVYGIVCFFINSYYTKRYVGYGSFNQLLDVAPVLLISFVMFLVVSQLGTFLGDSSHYMRLLAQVSAGIFLFLIASFLFKTPGMLELLDISKSLANRRKEINLQPETKQE